MKNRAERIVQSAAKLLVNDSWQIEQRAREINRLQGIQRDPTATREDKDIAADMLAYWQSDKAGR